MSAPYSIAPLKVLLAIDGSPYSTAAVNLLTHIVWPVGTSIHLLAMVPDRLPLMDVGSEVQNVVDEALAIRRWRDWAAARIHITEAAPKLKACNLTIESEICEGTFANVLLERAKELSVDLIGIGAKEFSTPGSFRLGATAHKLIQYADYPVLVVRPSMQVRPLSTILAVDGSPEAWWAVEFLCALSLPQWARVTVVNVVEEKLGIPAGHSFANHYRPAHGRRMMPGAMETISARVIARLHDFGVQVRRIIRFGCPADEILAAAQEQDADLIVIGTRSQTQSGCLDWSGLTQKVVIYAPCSVLSVRRRESEKFYEGSDKSWKDRLELDYFNHNLL